MLILASKIHVYNYGKQQNNDELCFLTEKA